MVSVLELIQNKPSLIRSSNELMMAYLHHFYTYFGRKPICSGCTFDKDFNALLRQINKGEEPKYENNLINEKNMNTTFIIRDISEIYSYRPKDSAVKRCYGSNMTEDFAIAYLTNGTEQEREFRKKQFKKLPDHFTEKKENENNTQERKPRQKRP